MSPGRPRTRSGRCASNRFAALGEELLTRCALRRGRRYVQPDPGRRARGPDAGPAGPTHSPRVRGPPMGRRHQPRGDRRAGPARSELPILIVGAYRRDEHLPARRCGLAGPPADPAARGGDPPRAADARGDRDDDDAPPGDRAAGIARRRRGGLRAVGRPAAPRRGAHRRGRAAGTDRRAAIRAAMSRTPSRTPSCARAARRSADAQAVARAGAVIGRCFVPTSWLASSTGRWLILKMPSRSWSTTGSCSSSVWSMLVLRLPSPAPARGALSRDAGTRSTALSRPSRGVRGE